MRWLRFSIFINLLLLWHPWAFAGTSGRLPHYPHEAGLRKRDQPAAEALLRFAYHRALDNDRVQELTGDDPPLKFTWKDCWKQGYFDLGAKIPTKGAKIPTKGEEQNLLISVRAEVKKDGVYFHTLEVIRPSENQQKKAPEFILLWTDEEIKKVLESYESITPAVYARFYENWKGDIAKTGRVERRMAERKPKLISAKQWAKMLKRETERE